jgi:phosphoenolpyruvate carboxylase
MSENKVIGDLNYLLQCLVEVLEDLEEPKLVQFISYLLGESPIPENLELDKTVQILSLYFQLLNMVEENSAAQFRRKVESDKSFFEISGLWGEKLKDLIAKGFTENQIIEAIQEISIEPVLTAHPTEAKRGTVLEQHRELYLLLVKKENPIWTPLEKKVIREDIKLCLERLWRTGEIYLERPDVSSERKNIIHYLKNVFPNVLPMVDERLKGSWEEVGFSLDSLNQYSNFPKLTFGNWVGGDRDGHPFVTPKITEATLYEFRNVSLNIIDSRLKILANHLSLSDRIQHPSQEFQESLNSIASQMGEEGEKAIKQNSGEPWKQYVSLILTKLPVSEERPSQFKNPKELLDTLDVLKNELQKIKAFRIIERELIPTQRIIQAFGFHLASLDIRQNSKYHDIALNQLLKSAGFKDYDFASWTEEKRIRFLTEELEAPRPFVLPDMDCGEESKSVLGTFSIISKFIKKYGIDSMGAFIVSMTRSVSDLLVVYIFARETGLLIPTDEGMICPIPVVPLLETIEDLEAGPEILNSFINHPMTKRSLKYQSIQKNESIPTQQIMLGYSDSNKDGGILASQWNLYCSQKKLSSIANSNNIKFKYFHGRGGTISRGGGKTHRFMQVLPHTSFTGSIRMTIQGESIAQQFANWNNATYNLELLLASSVSTLLKHKFLAKKIHPLEEYMDQISDSSKTTYQSLLNHEGFMEFYGQATPIDAIENSKHGSRPSRRTGKRTLGDLRAIPWVFSWNQSRFYLPGWFGAGSALKILSDRNPQMIDLFQREVKEWHFFRHIIMNIEANLMSVDKNIILLYADLVENEVYKNTFLQIILQEYEITKNMLETIFGVSVEERRQRMMETMHLRSKGLTELHKKQISLLKEWRSCLKKENLKEAEEVLIPLLLTINAIAGGLRTTG